MRSWCSSLSHQPAHRCDVVAPLLIERVCNRAKTDRRDATMLARLHRAVELTSIGRRTRSRSHVRLTVLRSVVRHTVTPGVDIFKVFRRVTVARTAWNGMADG